MLFRHMKDSTSSEDWSAKETTVGKKTLWEIVSSLLKAKKVVQFIIITRPLEQYRAISEGENNLSQAPNA